MENKVYCDRCKHKRYVDFGGYEWHECKMNPGKYYDYLHAFTINHKCNVKNKNNDCPDFEEKLSLWNWIVTKFPVI